MQKQFDFLASDKEPFFFLEKSKVFVDDGKLVYANGQEGLQQIAPAAMLVLCLGAGTSITQEAAIMCAKNDLQIAFSRGGCHLHSVFMSDRFPDPIKLVNLIANQENYKFPIASELLRLRFKKINVLEQYEPLLQGCHSIEDLSLLEARFTKQQYRKYSLKSGTDFKRDFLGTDIVNERLNILNNCLYSVATAICLATHANPSIAFLHGYSRRGGLAFDLVDLIKNNIVLSMAFDKKIYSTKELMWALSKEIKSKRNGIIALWIEICLMLTEKIEDFNSFKRKIEKL